MLLTLDGAPIFGVPLSCLHNANATAQQVAAFFGVSGTQSIFGGTRGRVFMISGLYFANSMADLRGIEATLETYADGVPRTLQVGYPDSSTYSWANVVYKNEYKPKGPAYLDSVSGQYCQVYQNVLYGLF